MPQPTTHTDTDLTETERATLTNALYVAAERFDEHVRDLINAADPKPAYASLATQFAKQSKEARALAERVNDAEFIRLGNPAEEAEETDPRDEPEHDDSVKCCPDCEKPNQFGDLCAECEREREANHDPLNCSACGTAE